MREFRVYSDFDMIPAVGDDLSMVITTRCLKMIGYWMAADRIEQSHRNLMIVYTVFATSFLFVLAVVGLSYSLDNTSDMVYWICNLATVVISLLKLFAILANRTEFFNLILYLQRKFLESNYDVYEKAAVDTCKRNCSIYICSFTFFSLAVCASYILSAVVANIGKSDSDRLLPINMYIDIESTTPYCEILFTIQSAFLFQMCLGYFSFDNILCIICLHTSCQFRILQYRLRNLSNIKDEKKGNGNCSENYYAAFRNSVQYHQALIAFSNKFEEVFNLFALYQVLIYSLIICLDIYQIVMENVPFSRRITCVFYLMGCIVQLLMFTYSCDSLLRDSANAASSMYDARWSQLPMDKDGRRLRKGLMLVVARARVPCYLTACGFFVISLETYTKILSTAVSYFTLLRQHAETVEGP